MEGEVPLFCGEAVVSYLVADSAELERGARPTFLLRFASFSLALLRFRLLRFALLRPARFGLAFASFCFVSLYFVSFCLALFQFSKCCYVLGRTFFGTIRKRQHI